MNLESRDFTTANQTNPLGSAYLNEYQNIDQTKQANLQEENADNIPNNGIKIQRHGKLAIVKAVLTSPDAVKPFLKTLGYSIAEFVTVGETSKKFQAKTVHAAAGLISIIAQFYFGSDAVGNARNIGRKDVLEKKEDYNAAIKLLYDFKIINNKKVVRDVAVGSEKENVSLITDGICAGIRLDIAKRYLIDHEELNTIIKNNEKGATSEASANQAIYSLLSSNESIEGVLIGLFTNFFDLSKIDGENILNQVDINLVGQALVQSNEKLRNLDPGYYEFSKQYPLNSSRLDDLPHLIKTLIEEEKIKVRGLEQSKQSVEGCWMGRNQDSSWTIKDPLAFKKAVQSKINEKYSKLGDGATPEKMIALSTQKEKEIESLNLTVGLIEFMQEITETNNETKPVQPKEEASFKQTLNTYWVDLKKRAILIFGTKDKSDPKTRNISDPRIRYLLETLADDHIDDTKYHAVAAARGLKLLSLKNVMGHHSLFQSDDAYLENLPKLEPGAYAVDFATGKGSHAITYVKVSEQEAYILDPNGFQIQCGDPQKTIQQFKKLLFLYEEPSKKRPTQQKKTPNHHLVFQKFEVLK